MFLTMTSQDSVYNSLYLTNYAKLNLVDQLTRVPGVGAVNVMGAGDYSMRIWLDPEAMRIRNISPQQVYQSIQSQNVEVSAGYIGQPIGQDNNNAFQYTLNVQGRLKSPGTVRRYYYPPRTERSDASPEGYCTHRFGGLRHIA